MGSVSKSFALIFIGIIAISFVCLVGSISMAIGQSGTNISGIISKDTTWSQTNSPYNFVGNVLVNNGVTLTIEAGVTVDLNSYYMVINGTLQAKGTSTNQIRFNDGIKDYDVLRFNSLIGYNEATGTGNLLDHTYFSGGIGISNGSSPKIVDSDLYGISVWYGGSPIITNNQISMGIYIFGNSGSSQISYNTINRGEIAIENSGVKATITNNNILAQDGRPGLTTQGDVIVTGNSISYGISASGTFQISNNSIVGGGISISQATGTISYNTISNATDGIKITPSYYAASNVTIQGNVIFDCTTGINDVSASAITLKQTVSTPGTLNIQKNLIKNNDNGIICSSDDNTTIEYNTIAGSSVGMTAPASSTLIAYNNIQDNNLNIKAATANADAKNNWWGTTDQQAINQSIYDFKNDFNLGTVNFVPFLTAPNSQAPSLSLVTSTSPTPTITPSVPELSWLVIVPLLLSVFFVAVVAVAVRHRKTSNLSK